MNENLKYIPLGSWIQTRIEECGLDIHTVAESLHTSTSELQVLFQKESVQSGILLKFCKLLSYDFFRIYTQHLILYAPQEQRIAKRKSKTQKQYSTSFVKNIYTQEVISYLIELSEKGKKTYKQLSEEYNIPPTTLTRWADKYGNTFLFSNSIN